MNGSLSLASRTAEAFHLSFTRGHQLSKDRDTHVQWELNGVQLYAQRSPESLQVSLLQNGPHPAYPKEQRLDRASFYQEGRGMPTMRREWTDRRWKASLYWEFRNTSPNSLPSWFTIISNHLTASVPIRQHTFPPGPLPDPNEDVLGKIRFDVGDIRVTHEDDLSEEPAEHKLKCLKSEAKAEPTLLFIDEALIFMPRLADADYQAIVVPLPTYPGLEDVDENAAKAVRKVADITVPLLMHYHSKPFRSQIFIAAGIRTV